MLSKGKELPSTPKKSHSRYHAAGVIASTPTIKKTSRQWWRHTTYRGCWVIISPTNSRAWTNSSGSETCRVHMKPHRYKPKMKQHSTSLLHSPLPLPFLLPSGHKRVFAQTIICSRHGGSLWTCLNNPQSCHLPLPFAPNSDLAAEK